MYVLYNPASIETNGRDLGSADLGAHTDDSLRILGSRCAQTELAQLLLGLVRERI